MEVIQLTQSIMLRNSLQKHNFSLVFMHEIARANKHIYILSPTWDYKHFVLQLFCYFNWSL